MTSHASKTSPDSESSTTEDSTASFKSGVRSKDCGRGAHSHCKSELQKEESIKLAERMAEALARARSDPAAAAVAASAAKRQAPSSALAYLMHNNIMKRTLHTGGGSLAPLPDECRAPGGGIAYPRETKFIFDYRIRDPDEPDVFLDDTKKYGKRMELYSGKDFQIEVGGFCCLFFCFIRTSVLLFALQGRSGPSWPSEPILSVVRNSSYTYLSLSLLATMFSQYLCLIASFCMQFWEQCLGTMLIGEVASFLVPARCLVSFPAVNKKLRDYMLNKGGPGSAGGVPKHTCGFMSLREQGGLGYPDLDDLMTNPKTLEFIFELIS
ncbi:unnamed protein product [Schistocephalus solidus]|uniref:Calpain catalytic domain-containing protein n=1 Tax=Schistocephalus solidus TaxID=70667 RepID=A0A183SUX4_SCHSO|nr:unnamed protein product [Schistocephalus solidus]